jgi:phosphohistidine phosphatase
VKLYFLRHGIAEDPRPGQSDRDRQLTPEGIAGMRAESEVLRQLNLKLDLILTSPYDRARQTAEIVAEALGLTDKLEMEPRLAPGCRLGDLQEIVGDRPQVQRIMLVSHNPDLPVMAGQLAGGANIDMKKGGLIRIDTDRVEPGAGMLEWIFTPGVLLKLP